MNINRAMFSELFRTDYKTVQVHFNESNEATRGSRRNYQSCDFYNAKPPKAYTYKCPKHMAIANGDQLLVNTSNNPDAPVIKLVTVINIDETPQINTNSGFDYKWIVGNASTMLSSYWDNMERDKKLKLAVSKLETLVQQRMLRTQVNELLNELPEAEQQELRDLFGADLRPNLEIDASGNNTET